MSTSSTTFISEILGWVLRHLTLTSLVATFDQNGVELVAISPQKPAGSLTMQKADELTHTLLSDHGNEISRRLEMLDLPRCEDARAVAAASGTYDVAMPTAILVDASGIIRWIDVHPGYTVRNAPLAVLETAAGAIG